MTDMTMVERVARAICEQSGEPWNTAGSGYREICEGFARAAIAAMEPNHEMLKAMWNAMFQDKWTGHEAPMMGAGFDAAIKAALDAQP